MIILNFIKIHDLLVSLCLTFLTIYICDYFDVGTYVSGDPYTGMLGLFLLELFVLIVTFSIIRISAYIKIFKYENIPSWKAYIPFYAEYTLCKLTGTNVIWSFLELTPIIINIIYSAISFLDFELSLFPKNIYDASIYIVSIFGSIIPLAKIVYSYILAKNITKKFGKEESFKWKLFFLPIIYYMKVVSNKPEKKEIDYSNKFTPNINKTNENNMNITNPNQSLNNQSYTNNMNITNHIPPSEGNNLNNK